MPLHTDGVHALLHIPGLVRHQRPAAAQMLDARVPHDVPDPVVIPRAARQERLHHRRGGVAGLLSDRPAVLTRQLGKQPAHHPLGGPTRLDPAGHPPTNSLNNTSNELQLD
ncbi:MAG TPA: hypothetical protein VIU94_16335 [Streptomyces sp.]